MPLKVLMFGWELPPYNSGGLGVACCGLTQALADQNVDITFVLPQKLPVKAGHMQLIFADLPPFDQLPAVYSTFRIGNLDFPLPPGMDFLTAARLYAIRAAHIAGRYPHDLVHAHDWLCFGAGISASTTSHRPLVSHVHATEYDRSGGTSVNPVVYAIEKESLNSSDAVIAVSRFTKNLLTRYYGTADAKVHVVHNGVDAAEYSENIQSDLLAPLKAAGFKVVLYVGRITLQKGPDYFLRSAAEVLKFYPKAVFLIVGSGDMEHQIVAQAADLGISDHVLFAGFLRGEQLKQAFHSADLFVMPSVSEPFGITALESVASGTPAIISKQSGVSEALSHVLKVDFWDVEEMTNQILSVLNYPSLHKTLRANGQKEVKKNSWATAAAKVIDVYNKVLNR